MENIDFIAWMLLYPLFVSIWSYIDALKDKVKGYEKKYSKNTEGYAGMVIVFIWLFVGYHLFN